MKSGLPIDEILPALRKALVQHRSAVIEAPPGAGKSTVVPIALLGESWLRGGKIVMLEPRRLATRAVAQRMAATLGEPVGETVGYRMRLESRVSARTRIEVVTEGVFTRMLQHDPALEGVAAVLFDEFHERSLHADTGLAFALDSRRNLAPELRLVVMSATLDGAGVAKLLGDSPSDVPVITAAGRVYPVDVRYAGTGLPPLPGLNQRAVGEASPELAVLRVIKRALTEAEGDMLVFLPGAGEIRRVQGMLSDVGTGVDVLPLYGELAPGDQDAAIAPARAGRRKIVLATNIAETSLTIDGVRIVIDAGLERRSLFDPSSGMSRLDVMRISRASAAQRTGRAGRTAPGVCYRLWSEGAERGLAAYAPPEVCVADLAPLALDLAVWGTAAEELRWLDAPPAATLASARDLLRRLGALDAAGRVTDHGRAMQRFAAHPRLAHMMLKSRSIEAAPLAATLAALLSDRDVLKSGGGRERDSDVRSRLDALHRGTIDRGALERVRRAQRSFLQLSGGGQGGRADADLAGVLLAHAYPDRIGRRRAGADARYQLANGRGALFESAESIARQDFIVAVDLDDREREARIRLAAPLDKDALLEAFAAVIVRADELTWDEKSETVIARRVVRLDELVIEEKPLGDVPRAASAAAMLDGVRRMGIDSLPWDDEAEDFLARAAFVSALGRVAGFPTFSREALAADLGWLEPFLEGATRRSQLARVRLLEALRARLTFDQQRRLDELAPTHIGLPTGSRVRIDYRDDNAPVASMRMQEVFGLAATPRIGGGAVPVTFKLLSPGHKPLQITRDLESFWKNAYVEVRKDMRGRYPRHYWPENPLEAEPTRRAKPRGT